MTTGVSNTGSYRWLWLAVVAIAVVAGLTLVARYTLIEPMAFVAACERQQAPQALCLLREGLVILFVKNILGMASTVFGVWSTITRTRALAVAAIALGAMSVILFRFDAAFIGIVLGLLVLARALAGSTDQLTQAEQQHQA